MYLIFHKVSIKQFYIMLDYIKKDKLISFIRKYVSIESLYLIVSITLYNISSQYPLKKFMVQWIYSAKIVLFIPATNRVKGYYNFIPAENVCNMQLRARQTPQNKYIYEST